VGLQTWNSSAEFRDLRVTRGTETLYAWDPARKLEGWSNAEEGQWSCTGESLLQAKNDATRTTITTGDMAWRDYTVRVKARKRGGGEGFIVRVRDQGGRFVHVNFGGWGNTAHGIEQYGRSPIVQKTGHINEGRWYDVEVALDGEFVSAKLDGVTVFDHVRAAATEAPAFTMVAGYDRHAREIVVKCVNPSTTAQPLQMRLAGAEVPAQQARCVVLTGQETDVNDLEHPTRVAPVEEAFAVAGPEIATTLKPSSLTVLRIKTNHKP
jgi:alpha-L-arabinofuranosidase